MTEDNKEKYDEISALIHSDSSPVGIDAKKTHILILMKLDQIQTDLKRLEERIIRLEA